MPLPLQLVGATTVALDKGDVELSGLADLTALVPIKVFESIRIRGEDGQLLGSSEQGALTLDELQQVGRPWSQPDREFLYHEQIWSVARDDGTTEEGYRVFRTVNDSLPAPVLPLLVTDAVWQALATDGAEASLDVVVTFRAFPDWDVPIKPAMSLSTADLAEVETQRTTAKEARVVLFEEVSADVRDAVLEDQGSIVAEDGEAGWLVARVSPAMLEQMTTRADLATVDILASEGQALWTLGQAGTDVRTGNGRFISNGITGEHNNLARHDYGDIVAAIFDTRIEDEACLFYDNGNCTSWSRLVERLDCSDPDGDNDRCEFTLNYADLDADSIHGMHSASILLGDYSDNQCNGFTCGDATTTHTNAWETDRNGAAPEARLIYFSDNALGGLALAEALAEATTREVDVFNGSLGYAPSCTLSATQPYEVNLEIAFDTGVLPVFAAGNAHASPCSMWSPADTPKAFAVNGIHTGSGSAANYLDTELSPTGHANGGMNAIVDGTTYPAAISGIALSAPTGFDSVTDNQGPFGEATSGASGSSSAAPYLAGTAILLKDQQLALGNAWINDAGWLSTIMLAMADRHHAPSGPPSVQGATGFDRYWGGGRLRSRLLGNGGGLGAIGIAAYSLTFTTSSSLWSATLWPTPLPSSVGVVKCVMAQMEGMSGGKTEVNDVDLTLRVTAPGTTGSCATLGVQVSIRSDTSRDLKSMVAYETPDDLSGRCVQVLVNPFHVIAPNINTKTYCYFTTVKDDQAPQ